MEVVKDMKFGGVVEGVYVYVVYLIDVEDFFDYVKV